MVKVTKKYQVTIPEEARRRIGLTSGEDVEVIPINDNEILIRRKVKKVKDPLSTLIGKEEEVEVPPEVVDELAER
ncbi:MAG: AbrB/MazE/SpoVT family DNA-binding domain-containing protein [Zestosphaera sp.]|uniref:AbrB family transcriptional regulator n=1 Tax=Metallosphaera cuprina (strain Ar-4) TaxID=1006006 RepID=F4G2U9_METCR|nr:AbrB/MazE/SpoVT family DNA-binding domain-containing protein [Metallosphaera cuprina]AEB95147.1 AbrB family transcriptional regulator [Metallosphaera cuprina Ar-4]